MSFSIYLIEFERKNRNRNNGSNFYTLLGGREDKDLRKNFRQDGQDKALNKKAKNGIREKLERFIVFFYPVNPVNLV